MLGIAVSGVSLKLIVPLKGRLEPLLELAVAGEPDDDVEVGDPDDEPVGDPEEDPVTVVGLPEDDPVTVVGLPEDEPDEWLPELLLVLWVLPEVVDADVPVDPVTEATVLLVLVEPLPLLPQPVAATTATTAETNRTIPVLRPIVCSLWKWAAGRQPMSPRGSPRRREA
jgi:hypothetical protein